MNVDSSIERGRQIPDLEDLAAYLDGRLSEDRRAMVEERLLRDEEYYDLFMESAQFLQEDEEIEPGIAPVVKHPAWQRSLKWASPLAAAATVTLLISWQLLSFKPKTDPWTSLIDAPMVIHNGGEDWTNPGWSVLRGGGSTPPDRIDIDWPRAQQLAFRMGSRAVQLQIALAAGDRDAATTPAGRLIVLTQEDSLFFLNLPDQYEDLYKQLEDGELEDLRSKANELESQLLEVFQNSPAENHYASGIWNEVGRFAALSKDDRLLRNIWRRGRVVQKLYDDSIYTGNMDALRAALEPSPPDYTAAKLAFSGIAEFAAGPGV